MSEMPTELVVQDEKGQVVTDSLTVAAKFEKRPADVNRAIEKLIEKGVCNFTPSKYLDKQGKTQAMYIMGRDGFTFLVMGFTGDKAFEFKKQYVAAFNAMKKKLMEKKPASQLEVLVGVANGLLEQDKKLKELEGKVAPLRSNLNPSKPNPTSLPTKRASSTSKTWLSWARTASR